MLKECYYQSQSNYTNTDFIYLHRFIDRMIIKILNQKIVQEIKRGNLPENYMLNIKCIGGFAMSYWNLRDAGLTEYMDSLEAIDDVVRDAIRTIAIDRKLPFDWINDTMCNFYTNADLFQWVEIPWYLGRDSRIRVYVCSREDLLRNKIRLAERYLAGMDTQDRDAEPDYYDAKALLRYFGIGSGTNPAFAKIKLENMGIYQKDYPKMFDEILGMDYEDDEDYHLLGLINRVEQKQLSFPEFQHIINDQMGYSIEDIQRFYSMYLNEFPYFKSLL